MKNILITEPDAIKRLIEEAVEAALSTALPKVQRKLTSKPVYTIEEVCEMLGVTRRHLQYLRDSEQIAYIQNGRKILFRAEDLEAFFQNHYVQDKNRKGAQ